MNSLSLLFEVIKPKPKPKQKGYKKWDERRKKKLFSNQREFWEGIRKKKLGQKLIGKEWAY